MRTRHTVPFLILVAGCGCPASAPAPLPPASRPQAQTPAGPKGRIVVEPVEYDLGIVRTDNPLYHTFTIRNEGNAPLNIRIIEVCAGTRPPDVRVLQPGASEELLLSINMRGIRGRVAKCANIYGDDPLTPCATVTLKADVRAPIPFRPIAE